MSQGRRVQINGALQLVFGHVLTQKSCQLAQKTSFDELVC